MENSKKLAKSTLALVIFALIGKIFGYARETLMAYYFGASMATDAFVASQKATSLFSALVSSSIATTFIPMLARVEEDDPSKKFHHTNNMLILSTTAGAIVAGLGILFAPIIVKIVGGGFDKETFDLTVQLTKIGMPVIIFSAIVGIMTGFLQSEGRFAATGAIAIPLNIIYISYMVLFSKRFGIQGMAVASVLGVVAQAIFLLPDTIKSKFKFFFVFDIKDKYVIHALTLCIPVVFSVAINDINIIINTHLASGMAEGTVTWINYANKLNILILGVFTSAVTAVSFPILSRAFSAHDIAGGKKAIGTSVRSIMLVTIPSTVGLIVLSKPIVEIAFVHGKFTQYDADMTSPVLKFYALALCAMSLNNILNRVYYSVQDTKTPVKIGAISVLMNVILNLILIRFLGHIGLALALSIATNISVLISFLILKKKLNGVGGWSYLRCLIKSLISSLVMGVVTYFSYFGIMKILPFFGGRTATKLILLLFSILVSVLVYLAMTYTLGIGEVKLMFKMLKRKKKSKN